MVRAKHAQPFWSRTIYIKYWEVPLLLALLGVCTWGVGIVFGWLGW
jgi:hypothetical protein